MISVVGVGPGSKEYLTEKAKSVIEEADIVAGWDHALKVVGDLIKGERVQFTSYRREEKDIAYLAQEAKKRKKCTICVTGDPNFSDYQLLEKIRKYEKIEIVPGISSIQIAASLAQVPLEYTLLITFHKSGSIEKEKKELLEGIRKGKNLIILPRPYDFMPQDIAHFLIEHGVNPSLNVVIFENLTLKEEKRSEIALREIKGIFSDLSIIVIRGVKGKGALADKAITAESSDSVFG
jgi:precorrin-6y C5,15-methyltransferase (decarboxylating) CbiE subunit